MRLHNHASSVVKNDPALSSIGHAVLPLCQNNAYGEVVARFERCAYIEFDAQLVCIGLNELGGSSITILFDRTARTLPQSLIVGATVQLTVQRMSINDQYFFDLCNAQRYSSQYHNTFSGYQALATQYDLLAKLTIPGIGVAPILRAFNKTAGNASCLRTANAISSESHLLSFLMPSIVQLSYQLKLICTPAVPHRKRPEFDPAQFKNLIGAGPGLTPSGDDFLCGIFTVLHLSSFVDVADSLWVSIQPIAQHSTTPVSFALLEQSAQGESSERLNEIILAYLGYTSKSAKQIQHLLENIGESSGWDWLTGFVWAADALQQIKGLRSRDPKQYNNNAQNGRKLLFKRPKDRPACKHH